MNGVSRYRYSLTNCLPGIYLGQVTQAFDLSDYLQRARFITSVQVGLASFANG